MPGCPASVYLVCILGHIFNDASALKLPQNILTLPDLDLESEAVEREIVEGDQHGASVALLAAAEKGRHHLEMVWALLALDYDLNDLQEWLSSTSPLPPSPSASLSRESHEGLVEDFRNLLENLRANRPDSDAVKALIVSLARAGGAHRVSSALQALQALGYSPQELQSWIEQKGKGQAPTKGPAARAIENSWNVYLLIDALKHSSRADVKQVLAHIGTQEMVNVLGIFTALGYDYNGLLKRLQESSKVETHSDFALLLKDLEAEAETRADVKEVFARLLRTGKLSSSFAKLQSMGYDLHAVKHWYQSHLRAPPPPPQPQQKDPAPGKLGEVFRNESMMLPAPAKRLLPETMQDTSVTSVPEPHLHALGDETKHLQDEKTPKSAQTTVAVAAEATARGIVEVPLLKASSSNSRLDKATGFDELLLQVHRAYKAEVIRLLSSEFRSGGRPRVEQAFAFLEAAGYNHKDVQAWLTGGPAPVRRM
mmetsp:Transcript_17596/g.41371  ORF Transcript_17596/g.41371 Transcript_17596/m.41371 type:complete len:482 (+) Transcript_17596:63-1508(+)|eukprot:s1513_g11.t1